jgi:hypothetical protein
MAIEHCSVVGLVGLELIAVKAVFTGLVCWILQDKGTLF